MYCSHVQAYNRQTVPASVSPLSQHVAKEKESAKRKSQPDWTDSDLTWRENELEAMIVQVRRMEADLAGRSEPRAAQLRLPAPSQAAPKPTDLAPPSALAIRTAAIPGSPPGAGGQSWLGAVDHSALLREALAEAQELRGELEHVRAKSVTRKGAEGRCLELQGELEQARVEALAMKGADERCAELQVEVERWRARAEAIPPSPSPGGGGGGEEDLELSRARKELEHARSEAMASTTLAQHLQRELEGARRQAQALQGERESLQRALAARETECGHQREMLAAMGADLSEARARAEQAVDVEVMAAELGRLEGEAGEARRLRQELAWSRAAEAEAAAREEELVDVLEAVKLHAEQQLRTQGEVERQLEAAEQQLRSRGDVERRLKAALREAEVGRADLEVMRAEGEEHAAEGRRAATKNERELRKLGEQLVESEHQAKAAGEKAEEAEAQLEAAREELAVMQVILQEQLSAATAQAV